MTKIYIAGPITGVKHYASAFRRAAQRLKREDTKVMTPHILPEWFEQDEYMHICYAMMDCCDTIYMLPGWQESKGATLEHERAKERGMTIIYG